MQAVILCSIYFPQAISFYSNILIHNAVRLEITLKWIKVFNFCKQNHMLRLLCSVSYPVYIHCLNCVRGENNSTVNNSIEAPSRYQNIMMKLLNSAELPISQCHNNASLLVIKINLSMFKPWSTLTTCECPKYPGIIQSIYNHCPFLSEMRFYQKSFPQQTKLSTTWTTCRCPLLSLFISKIITIFLGTLQIIHYFLIHMNCLTDFDGEIIWC
jgi:hypothetical protein